MKTGSWKKEKGKRALLQSYFQNTSKVILETLKNYFQKTLNSSKMLQKISDTAVYK